VFEKLSGDGIWSVRKGCVESLVEVSSSSSKKTQKDVFIPMVFKFVRDVSRWVRHTAYKNLGPFLYSLDENMVSLDLVIFSDWGRLLLIFWHYILESQV
jgi:hypothetical protein